MAQKYRIYIDEKVILITESEPAGVDKYQKIEAQGFDLKIIYPLILNQKKRFFYVFCKDARALLKTITKSVTLIKAAGGLVKNQNAEHLFIYRNGKWDLPKGKVERNEKVKEAAVREVEEECGIKVDKLGDKICKTYHVYTNKGDLVLKKTHWFDMKCMDTEKLKPQTEEGITEVRWFKKDHINPIISNTFPSIKDVLVTKRLIKDKREPLLE